MMFMECKSCGKLSVEKYHVPFGPFHIKAIACLDCRASYSYCIICKREIYIYNLSFHSEEFHKLPIKWGNYITLFNIRGSELVIYSLCPQIDFINIFPSRSFALQNASDSASDIDERKDDIIDSIMDSNCSCSICGEYYESFPAAEIVRAHIKKCGRGASQHRI